MRLILCLFLLGVVTQFNAQQTYEPGKLTDSIPVSNTSNETFALYLPTSFVASQASPILFIFEPAARGRLGIQTFIEASETYGHILVCSNNSKNGPYERNLNIAANLFDHVFSGFKINEDQMYFAGFSGGSRLAWALAFAAGNIAGVIACGAGLWKAPSPILPKQEFSYVGICGIRDMNYREMLGIKAYQEEINQDHTLITFEGGHSWPPAEEIARAFDWLDIEAHKKGIKVKTDNELFRSYRHNYEIAEKAEANGHILEAVENYERVLSTYGSLYTLDTVSARLKVIKKESSYKRALKDRTLALEKEKQWTSTFYERFTTDYNEPDKIDMQWWEKKITQLNDKYADGGIEFQRMLERVQYNLFAIAFSRKNPLLYQSNEDQKSFCTELGKLVYLESGQKQ
ncbi:hypothetical protein [uncultured Eudoraea sp.]|uniref:hypothetical protein n=1 Tax=uncultured Eudoraea sp. TaxID=1035614 RepID=UPI00261F501B|nr:hypothetical protein [uncultured Eudoraea sp.]